MARFIEESAVVVLNVAGPRSSPDSRGYSYALEAVKNLLGLAKGRGMSGNKRTNVYQLDPDAGADLAEMMLMQLADDSARLKVRRWKAHTA